PISLRETRDASLDAATTYRHDNELASVNFSRTSPFFLAVALPSIKNTSQNHVVRALKQMSEYTALPVECGLRPYMRIRVSMYCSDGRMVVSGPPSPALLPLRSALFGIRAIISTFERDPAAPGQCERHRPPTCCDTESAGSEFRKMQFFNTIKAETAITTKSTNRAPELIIHQLVLPQFANKTPPHLRLTTPCYAATDTRRQSIGIA
ncbi:hypothetical protein, partial [Acidomonas methanolica]|uniref:hypothetical protein n=1 Tax=Acidomonas methanolica TaxID=437 RepID=UPI001955224D